MACRMDPVRQDRAKSLVPSSRQPVVPIDYVEGFRAYLSQNNMIRKICVAGVNYFFR